MIYYRLLLLFLAGFLFYSFDLVEDLKHHLMKLRDGDQLMLTYSFEGCFGPYHHGTIDFEFRNDSIYFVEKNYDEKGRLQLTQAGRYLRTSLCELLEQASAKNSPEILGNVINYQLSQGDRVLLKSADRIEQQHFVEIFRPLGKIFSVKDKGPLPGLRRGGFTH